MCDCLVMMIKQPHQERVKWLVYGILIGGFVGGGIRLGVAKDLDIQSEQKVCAWVWRGRQNQPC